MKVKATIEVPGTILMLSDEADIPTTGVAVHKDQLLIEGSAVGQFLRVASQDGEEFYYSGESVPREGLINSTTIDCVLFL